MSERTAFITARATPFELLSVKAFAAARGLTVSELIYTEIIEKAVRPIRAAVLEAQTADEAVQDAAVD